MTALQFHGSEFDLKLEFDDIFPKFPHLDRCGTSVYRFISCMIVGARRFPNQCASFENVIHGRYSDPEQVVS